MKWGPEPLLPTRFPSTNTARAASVMTQWRPWNVWNSNLSCGLKLPMLPPKLTRILRTSFEALSSGTLRLFFCSAPEADGTASTFQFHGLWTGCRLASFHKAGDLTIFALTNCACVFFPLCVVAVGFTTVIHTLCGAEPRLQAGYLFPEVCDDILHFQNKRL